MKAGNCLANRKITIKGKGNIAIKEYIFHGFIEKEGDMYCALCLELEIATESDTLEGAKKNHLI